VTEHSDLAGTCGMTWLSEIVEKNSASGDLLFSYI
jgi:hypothetical protein